MTFYFAYGSNMDRNQMNNRCPDNHLIGQGLLPNYRFIINSRGVASVVVDSGSKVLGIIFRISIKDERTLDRYEGVRGGYYHKELLQINTEIGQQQALVYIASDNSTGPPRPGYLERIIKAAKEFNFPEDYIRNIESWK
jgi:gamma-glutamylcyclotransferase (GGCT)/AIG2-like uncharacterized protein YtfP